VARFNRAISSRQSRQPGDESSAERDHWKLIDDYEDSGLSDEEGGHRNTARKAQHEQKQGGRNGRRRRPQQGTYSETLTPIVAKYIKEVTITFLHSDFVTE
jgi:hypothetical protein